VHYWNKERVRKNQNRRVRRRVCQVAVRLRSLPSPTAFRCCVIFCWVFIVIVIVIVIVTLLFLVLNVDLKLAVCIGCFALFEVMSLCFMGGSSGGGHVAAAPMP